MLETIVDGLRKGLQERSESDEWLQSELDQYSERMAAHGEREQRQREAYQGLQKGLDSAQARLKQKYNEEGRHNADKSSHEQLLKNRSKMIKDKAVRHSIRGYDHDLDDEEIETFMKKISKLLKDQKSSVDKVRSESEAEVQHVQHALYGLRERRSGFIESRKSTKERTSTNDKKIESCRFSLKRFKVDEGGAALLESTIQDLDDQLKKAKEDIKSRSWDSDMQKADLELRSSDNKQKLLAKDLAQVTAKAVELARLDHLRKELSNSQRRLETMRGAHRERLQRLISQDWSPWNLQSQFQNVVQAKENEINEAKSLRDGVSRKQQQILDRLNSLRADLAKGEKEQRECADHIRDTADIDPKGYPEALEVFQESRDVAKSDADSFAAQHLFYTQCLETANQHGVCRTCQRGFDADDEKSRFVLRLKGLLAKSQKNLENDFEKCEEELTRVKEASPSHTTWLRLHSAELPRIRVELKNLEVERNHLVDQIEEHDRLVADRQQSKADVDTLSNPVKDIHQYNQDVQRFQSETQELAAKQKDAGLSRTVEDIQRELEAVNDKSSNLRASITKLKEERDAARSRVKDLELELSNAKKDLMTSHHDLEKKADLERQIEDSQRNNEEAREAARRLGGQITELEPLIAEEETKLADVKQRGLNKEKSLLEEASRLSDSVRQLEMISEQIQTYIDNGGPGRLAGCRREVERTEQETKHLQGEQTQITKELNKIRNELQGQKETRRNIEDNIKYRSSRRELEDVESEIARLEAANAEADLEHHQRSYRHWDQQRVKLRGEAERRQASMAAKDEALQQLINDFQQLYKDAAKDFKKSHIEVEVNLALPPCSAHDLTLSRQPKLRSKILADTPVRWISMVSLTIKLETFCVGHLIILQGHHEVPRHQNGADQSDH